MKTMIMLLVAAVALLAACSGDDTGTDPGSGNNAPAAPSNPQPASGATGVSTATQLTWQCSDPEGDAITYDVAFGTSNPPPAVSNDQASSSYTPGQLTASTTYYWKVTATDANGAVTGGPVWNFATGSSINQVGSFVTPTQMQDITVTGVHAYIADLSGGLLIVDISDPSQPVEIWRYDGLFYTFRVIVEGNYAYVLGRNELSRSNGLFILDISNPGGPTEVGHWDTTSQHTLGPLRIAKQGSYIYAAAVGGLTVIDVTTVSNPQVVGAVQGFSPSYNPQEITVSGQYAYIAEFYDGMYVFDVSVPSAPAFKRSYKPQGEWYETRGVVARQSTNYVVGSYRGLYLLDVVNPELPSVLSTVGGTNIYGLAISLSWPYLAFTTVANTSAAEYTLSVVRVDSPTNPMIIGTVPTEQYLYGIHINGNRIYMFNRVSPNPAIDGVLIFEFTQ